MMKMLRAIHILSLVFFACRAEDANDYQDWYENCDDAVVQVSNLEVLCDSNRTYYYGSSVHRNSVYCDEVDKAKISIDFDVDQDLGTSDIYMAMAISNEAGDVVYKEGPSSVCDMVGQDCFYQGSYSFSKQVYLQVGPRNQTNFLPFMQLAFSQKQNGKSDLGGVNIENCGTGTVSGSQVGSKRSFFGILGTIAMLLAVSAAAFMLVQHVLRYQHAKRKRDKSRMDQEDYGIIVGDGPEKSKSLVSSEDVNDEISSNSTVDNSQPSDPEEDDAYQAFDFEDHPKRKLKRGHSLLRLLRRKSSK